MIMERLKRNTIPLLKNGGKRINKMNRITISQREQIMIEVKKYAVNINADDVLYIDLHILENILKGWKDNGIEIKGV
jgi:hypothetical protein